MASLRVLGRAEGGVTGDVVPGPGLCECLVQRIGTRLPGDIVDYHWLAAGSVCTVSVGINTRTGGLSLVRSQQLGGVRDFLPGAAREIALCKKLRTPECPPDLALPTEWLLGRFGLISSVYPHEQMGMFDLYALAERRVSSGSEWWIPGRFLRLDDTMALVCPIVNAVAYLHRQRIVHCDLKLENCFVTPSGAVMVGDLGAAHGHGEKASHAMGTALYMAPECFTKGSDPVALAHVTPEIDVYALGLIADDMAIGRCGLMGNAPGVSIWDEGISLGLSDTQQFYVRSHILAKRDAIGMGFYDMSVAHWTSPDPSVPRDDANFSLLAPMLPAMMHPDPVRRPSIDGVARHLFHGELELSAMRRAQCQERVRQMFVRFCAPAEVLHALGQAQATGHAAWWCHLTSSMREKNHAGGTIERNLLQQCGGYTMVSDAIIGRRLEVEYVKAIYSLGEPNESPVTPL